MGKGLIITISKSIPSILNVGDEIVEIYQGNNYKGQTTIQIHASKGVGITGAHLLQKAYWERDKLIQELKDVQEKYNELINQRIQERKE